MRNQAAVTNGSRGLPQRMQSDVHMGCEATARHLEVHTTTLPLAVVPARDHLLTLVDDSLRQMERTAIGLTSKEVQLVKDVRRGRYIGGVLKTLEIGQKCEDVADATAFPEALRGWAVRQHPRLTTCWQSAFRAETDANGTANLAQFEFEVDPSEVNRQKAIEALNRQLVETYRALNALHKHDGTRR